MATRKSTSVDEFEKDAKKEQEFRCCKTKESTSKFCTKCKKFWHNSCLARNKKIKIFSSTEIECCDTTSNEEKRYTELLNSLAKTRESLKSLQAYCNGIEKQVKALQTENEILKNKCVAIPVAPVPNNNHETLEVGKDWRMRLLTKMNC